MKHRLILLAILHTLCSNVKAQLNLELLGNLDYDEILSSIWGWDDGAENEYALVGTQLGVSIVNITDPTAPEEIQFIPCGGSTIREISTWSNYAYVVGGYTDGLLCINLSTLPDSVNYVFRNLGVGFQYGHTIFCDENGIIHTFGGNVDAGDVMFDATVSPMNPDYIAAVGDAYFHDGFVRGDTLWAANITSGVFTVWDITDKLSPVLLATQETPYETTHNMDVTLDGNYLFSTDEATGACVAAYDVSDLSDIKEIDRFYADEGDLSIPHNTVIKDNFLITAWYSNGVIITDITHPDNMIKTGWFDTSPFIGDGFYGSWRVMPFLPSGVIITSDREEGLFILQPEYVQACYLEGLVTDASTGAPIYDADITIELSPDAATSTAISGEYKTGIINAGFYDVTFSKSGYMDTVVEDVSFSNGVLTELNVELSHPAYFPLTGMVIDAETGLPVENAVVQMNHLEETYETTSDVSGIFILPEVHETNYDIYCGKWGYHLEADTNINLNPDADIIFYLSKGYYDDFTLDYLWSAAAIGASTGYWVRDEPYGTVYLGNQSNPEYDIADDISDKCFVTGNFADPTPGLDDIDSGRVILTSPVFDLTGYSDPVLYYNRWYVNTGGTIAPDDSLTIYIDNGAESVLVDLLSGETTGGPWVARSLHVSDYIEPTADMTIMITAADIVPGHLIEAAFDKFYIIDSLSSAPVLAIEASITEVCGPQTINFSDLSDFEPVSWEWYFEGGTPEFAYIKNPVVDYTTPGIYDVTLSATNDIGTTVFTFSDYITIYELPALTVSSGTGTATVDITGGASPYTIEWDDPLHQTTETAVDLTIGTYTVTVTDANGCTATATIDVESQNSIQYLSGEIVISQFPNPFINEFIIELNAPHHNVYLIIFDMAGNEIYHQPLHNGLNILQPGDMAPGVYMAKIAAASGPPVIISLVKAE